MRDFLAEHHCGCLVRVVDDGVRWFFTSPARIDLPPHPYAPISHCPRCRRRLTRSKLRPVVRDTVST